MELIVRYGRIVGAEALCKVTWADLFCGSHHYLDVVPSDDFDVIFSRMSLCSSDTVNLETMDNHCICFSGVDADSSDVPDGMLMSAEKKARNSRFLSRFVDAGHALNDNGVANLLPMGGGIKGYGIVMLIEVLTGPLVHSLLSTEQTSGWNPKEYGFLMIGIDVCSFVDVSLFKKNVSQMCATIRSLTPAEGFIGVQIPGDRGHSNQERLMASGELEVDELLIEDLRLLVQ